MTRAAALLAALAGLALVAIPAGLLAACDRIVELEPRPDGGALSDGGFASDALDAWLDGGGGGDGGSTGGDGGALLDGGADAAGPDAI